MQWPSPIHVSSLYPLCRAAVIPDLDDIFTAMAAVVLKKRWAVLRKRERDVASRMTIRCDRTDSVLRERKEGNMDFIFISRHKRRLQRPFTRGQTSNTRTSKSNAMSRGVPQFPRHVLTLSLPRQLGSIEREWRTVGECVYLSLMEGHGRRRTDGPHPRSERGASTSEVLALKHESRILGQWTNPASASSPWTKEHAV